MTYLDRNASKEVILQVVLPRNVDSGLGALFWPGELSVVDVQEAFGGTRGHSRYVTSECVLSLDLRNYLITLQMLAQHYGCGAALYKELFQLARYIVC